MNNLLIAIGNVGKDPEMKYTPDGKAVTTFSVATNYSYLKDGQPQKETEWFNIVCWGKLAENCNQYLTKGKRVYVEGRVRTHSWEVDGQKKWRTEVIANKVLFLDKSDPSKAEAAPAATETDDLPF